MTDSKNFVIGLLSLCAVMLFCTLTVLNRTAHAEGGTLDKGGEYTLVTGSLQGGTDGVFIIDASMSSLLLYRLDQASKRIVPSRLVDLKGLVAAAGK